MKLKLKILRFLAILPLLLLGAFCHTSCTKIDTPPMLEIKVVNTNGQAVSGVMVALFNGLDEWSMLENPVQVWRETDTDGKVLFIDMIEEIYYFYADGDSLSNIGHEIKLLEPLRMNEKRQVTVTVE